MQNLDMSFSFFSPDFIISVCERIHVHSFTDTKPINIAWISVSSREDKDENELFTHPACL